MSDPFPQREIIVHFAASVRISIMRDGTSLAVAKSHLVAKDFDE